MVVDEKKYDYCTNVVSRKQFESHLKLYSGYVNKTNEITKTLLTDGDETSANAVYSLYRGLKKGETFSLDGMILHELYFQNMTMLGTSPSSRLREALRVAFGSFEHFLKCLIACATSARGWCILAYEQRTESFRILLQDTHDEGGVCMSYPLLVLDMYEHAYFLDYGTNKAEYILNFINGINWEVVEKRWEKLGFEK